MSTGVFLQRPLPHRTSCESVYGRQGRAKARSASPKTDAYAFLSQRISSIHYFDSPLAKVKTDGLYEKLIECCKRLFKFVDGFPVSKGKSLKDFVCLLEKMETWADKHDLVFMARKDYDEDIQFVLYKSISCLELRLFYFFVAPAESLPEPTASLYKRFINFVAANLCIEVIPEQSNNRYIDMILYGEFYEPEDEPSALKLYRSDKVRKLFEEVRGSDIENLYEDLIAHRKVCDTKCLELVESMIEGAEILPYINVSNYDFDPYHDGFDGDSSIDLFSTLAVLYSTNDGLEDNLIECVNSDNYCGLEPQGWNRWAILSPNMKKEEIDWLMEDDSLEKRFLDWAGDFYDKSKDWDKTKVTWD